METKDAMVVGWTQPSITLETKVSLMEATIPTPLKTENAKLLREASEFLDTKTCTAVIS